MKLNVSIAEDAVLRAEVKQLIEGQIKSVTSDMMREFVREYLDKHLKNVITPIVDKTLSSTGTSAEIRSEALKQAKNATKTFVELDARSFMERWLNQKVASYVEEKMGEWVGKKISETPVIVTIGDSA
ncbi:MAG: hypothetical protein JAY90_20015 [Candidatus Thiodiazotropha lotti]|nr:hypothetical protein [Candidatus Thiodiazotropha lotti]